MRTSRHLASALVFTSALALTACAHSARRGSGSGTKAAGAEPMDILTDAEREVIYHGNVTKLLGR
jgi:hypothetical protein